MSEQMLKACKELIDDAGLVCANLVFKETCLEILSKARIVLSDKQFKQLVLYVTEKMREKIAVEVQPTQPELTIQE